MDGRLPEEFNDFENASSGEYNDDKIKAEEMEYLELEDLHRSIDIKEDYPSLEYRQDGNEVLPEACDTNGAVKREDMSDMDIKLEELHHSIDIKEESSMNESQVDQNCEIPAQIMYTGRKPFECNICDYKCVRNAFLKSHMLTHTGKKLFECKICDFRSAFKASLSIKSNNIY